MILDEFNLDNGYKEIIKILFYADDAVLKFKLKDQIAALNFLKLCAKYNLILNIGKSKIMYQGGTKNK
jgi:hypothetical protein